MTVSGFIKTLESESEVVIDWFKKNKMGLKLGKFETNILYKRERDDTNERITVDN